jgi:hypothetical protein
MCSLPIEVNYMKFEVHTFPHSVTAQTIMDIFFRFLQQMITFCYKIVLFFEIWKGNDVFNPWTGCRTHRFQSRLFNINKEGREILEDQEKMDLRSEAGAGH